jgi:hypothetical protein
MTRSMSFYDLRDALSQPGCAVCRLRDAAAEGFLDSLLWESVNDPGKRHEIRKALGFCRVHAWALVRVSASLGVAIVTRDVLESLLRAMDECSFQPLPPLSLRRVHESLDLRQPSSATADVVARLEPESRCPACVWVEKMEAITLDTLIGHLLAEDGLVERFESSDGLCLPHFRAALTRVRDEATYRALAGAQEAIWQKLVTQLGESIRKSDHRFKEESWGEEAGAWIRAIAALVGPQTEKERK